MHMDAFIAALLIAGLSAIGILFFKDRKAQESEHAPFLPLSIGAFLGVAFFELLPEAFLETEYASIAIACGFLGFFLLSRALHEYHHHHRMGDEHAHEDGHHRVRGSLVLLGDGVHNFADGIVIAIAFSLSTELGIATAIGIAFHEVPQEIAQLYILLRAGYSRAKALFFNFLSALMIVAGVIVTNYFIVEFKAWIGVLIGIAAGNLLYIAASDLLPSLMHARVSRADFIRQCGFVVVGLVATAVILSIGHE